MRAYHVPDPYLQNAYNNTPFAHFQGQKMGVGRVFFDCVVVKGTFGLEHGRVPLAAEQSPIVLADKPHDATNAARSSLAQAGELHLAKPGTDVLVTGTAQAPGGRATTRWTCRVTVHDGKKPLLDHSVEATGPRRWTPRVLGGLGLSEPEATTSTPIRYELAYGGHYENRRTGAGEPPFLVYAPNPSGTGFFDEGALEDAPARPGPRWQLPDAPVTTINEDSPLAGFGPVARSWSSRLRFAGTYDAAWEARLIEDQLKGLVPDYPADFDARFFHAAHPALTSASPLVGDEFLSLRGFVADAPELVLRLPPLRPRVEALHGAETWKDHPAPLDTIHVDLDARRVHAVWRIVLDPRDRVSAVILHAEEGAPR